MDYFSTIYYVLSGLLYYVYFKYVVCTVFGGCFGIKCNDRTFSML